MYLLSMLVPFILRNTEAVMAGSHVLILNLNRKSLGRCRRNFSTCIVASSVACCALPRYPTSHFEGCKGIVNCLYNSSLYSEMI